MPYTFTHDEKPIPIVIRKRASARRMVIRYQPINHSLTLTLPRYVSLTQGLSFVEKSRSWIERQIGKQSRRVPFENGQVIPVMGKDCRIVHVGGRGVAAVEETELRIPGDAAFLARRVREWLKAAVKREIAQLAQAKAEALGVCVKNIGLRDTRSHWGSCSQSGRLSFSWRLVFAPYEVLDYLVCHEVAHLKELNHSAAFWRHVGALCPHYKKAQAWLKANGEGLYLYGS